MHNPKKRGYTFEWANFPKMAASRCEDIPITSVHVPKLQFQEATKLAVVQGTVIATDMVKWMSEELLD